MSKRPAAGVIARGARRFWFAVAPSVWFAGALRSAGKSQGPQGHALVGGKAEALCARKGSQRLAPGAFGLAETRIFIGIVITPSNPKIHLLTTSCEVSGIPHE